MKKMTSAFRAKRSEDGVKATRHYSSVQESQIAKAVKGNVTKNSGATMFQKGDVTTDNWLLEAKTSTTNKKSFSLKEEWFTKNKQESLFMNKEYSAVVFNFGPDKPNYYVIDELTFQELLEYQNNKERD